MEKEHSVEFLRFTEFVFYEIGRDEELICPDLRVEIFHSLFVRDDISNTMYRRNNQKENDLSRKLCLSYCTFFFFFFFSSMKRNSYIFFFFL